jgi:hypothetical protein
VWIADLGGELAHYDGTSWSWTQNELTSALTAISGTSASDVWGVGGGILHYNGTSWSRVANGSVNAVWASSPSDVWAVGRLLSMHYNGSGWSNVPVDPGFPEFPDAIWASSRSNAWVVGASEAPGTCCSGRVAHYDGTRWLNDVSMGTVPTLHAIWASSASDVWVVGDVGTLLHGTPAR